MESLVNVIKISSTDEHLAKYQEINMDRKINQVTNLEHISKFDNNSEANSNYDRKF